MRPTTELPDDPALPALAAIRAAGLAGVVPVLGLDRRPVELVLCGYTPGSRATLEVRSGPLRFAVKAYEEDPTPEVELYKALAAAGLAGDSGVRVPRLVAWDRDFKLLVIGWLEGQPTHELVRDGRGVCAGELAACWLKRVASLSMGAHRGAGADAARRAAPPSRARYALCPSRARPRRRPGRGSTGSASGRGRWNSMPPCFWPPSRVIGCGTSLRPARRPGRRRRSWQGSAASWDERALAWHRATALLHLARLLLKRQPPPEVHALLVGAARLAEAAR